jgi:hypothetical protein
MTEDGRNGNDRRRRRHEAGPEPGRAGNGARERAPRRRPGEGMLAARRAARQVLELTGHEPENVVSVERDSDGWQVGVEVLELHRVPETSDVMAVYAVVLDGHGELVRCQRGQRYVRASAGPQN